MPTCHIKLRISDFRESHNPIALSVNPSLRISIYPLDDINNAIKAAEICSQIKSPETTCIELRVESIDPRGVYSGEIPPYIDISHAAMVTLLATIKSRTTPIRKLSISAGTTQCMLQSQTVRSIAEFIQGDSRIEHLEFMCLGFTDAAAEAFAEVIKAGSPLKGLSIYSGSSQPLTDAGAMTLVNALDANTLQTLELRNKFHDDVAIAAARKLRGPNNHLRKFAFVCENAENIDVGVNVENEWIKTLEVNTNLHELNMSCKLSAQGYRRIAEVLSTTNFTTKVSGNLPPYSMGATDIQQMHDDHVTIRMASEFNSHWTSVVTKKHLELNLRPLPYHRLTFTNAQIQHIARVIVDTPVRIANIVRCTLPTAHMKILAPALATLKELTLEGISVVNTQFGSLTDESIAPLMPEIANSTTLEKFTLKANETTFVSARALLAAIKQQRKTVKESKATHSKLITSLKIPNRWPEAERYELQAEVAKNEKITAALPVLWAFCDARSNGTTTKQKTTAEPARDRFLDRDGDHAAMTRVAKFLM